MNALYFLSPYTKIKSYTSLKKKPLPLFSLLILVATPFSLVASYIPLATTEDAIRDGEQRHIKLEFKGNWTDTFYLKDGSSYIIHTPESVSLNNQMISRKINLNARSFNGMPMSEYGLDVQTNSTREEFVAALIKSGLFDRE